MPFPAPAGDRESETRFASTVREKVEQGNKPNGEAPMKRLAGVVLWGAFLGGCVAADTTMLDERSAIISGRGTNYTSQAQVLQKVLAEAATAAQARGYRYFVVLGTADRTTTGATYFPGQTTTTGTATGSCMTEMFCNAQYQQQSYTTPGAVVSVVRPGADVGVRFYKEGEIDPNQAGVWDSVSILAAQPKK